ncbi:ribonuclease P protein component [Pleurocapsa sp. PCC 7319]|uniref:ribonuclease P protein component n=1 Tax=Pleurocapsa sp. PCC 7319 TaxID=118161 RepID=UPI00034A0218|nr:ribonuclease P protein component [Pleurocapsa sp. PCC 7319]
MGLPKAHRLRNRQDYRAVYDQGIRRYSPHLTLVALFSQAQANLVSNSETMIGISISKKVSKKAVVRNRIKRQIKSVIRAKLTKMAPGWKIVIVVKPKAVECKYEHYLRELEELLKQATIINGY